MSHFLTGAEVHGARAHGRARAAVKVKVRTRGELEIMPGIAILKRDAVMAMLPDRVRLFDSSGAEVEREPWAVLFVTTETIDPFHMIIQVGP